MPNSQQLVTQRYSVRVNYSSSYWRK